MEIRKAEISDAEIIRYFQVQMAMETEQLLLDYQIVNKGVMAVFQDSTKGSYYVAEDNTKIIASMLITREWSDWRNGNVLWFQSVYVLPEYRNKGIFKSMYNYARNLVMNDQNLKGLRLYVDRSNKTAQNVYSNLGMNGEHYRIFEWMK